MLPADAAPAATPVVYAAPADPAPADVSPRLVLSPESLLAAPVLPASLGLAGTSVEPPSDDVARAPAAPTLPGEHRGGFRREMTQPLPIAPPLEVHPDPSTAEPSVHWIHPPPTLPRSAGWALLFGILGLILSFFVGWAFPVGLLGAVLAIIALRRPWESRELAVWALALSLVSLVYSAGWLWWAHSQGALFA
uniref:hypothetical protein n=1 Tax=Microbacterium sp. TaxID=51671 RepID=UPI003736DA74